MAEHTRNVTYLSFNGLSSNVGRSQIIPYVIDLSSYGYCFTIVSIERVDQMVNEIDDLNQLLQEKNINWKYRLRDNKSLNWIEFLKDVSFLKKNIHTNTTFIHARSYVAAAIGALSGKHWIFDMRGFYFDELYETNRLGKGIAGKVFYYFSLKIESWLLRKATSIITLTSSAKLLLEKKLNDSAITVIPCVADEEHFQKNTKAKKILREKLNISLKSKVVIYSGGLGYWYDKDFMTQAVAKISRFYSDTVFLVATKDLGGFKVLEERCKEHNIVLIKVEADYSSIVDYYSVADLALIGITISKAKVASSPIKVYEYMSCGLPIISNSGYGDIDFLLSDEKLGILNLSNISRTNISRLDAKRVREVAVAEYSIGTATLQYKAVYDAILA